ncbi:MAG: hypothetical protein AB7O91_00715 [Sphingomonas sp.]
MIARPRKGFEQRRIGCRIHVTTEDRIPFDPATFATETENLRCFAVAKMNGNGKTMILQSPRRFVKAAPPAVHAGVGDALRQAFDLNGEARSFAKFQDLLDQLT